MRELESGKDKVRKLCEMLRKETLEPAKEKAEQIIQEAEHKAEQILADAKQRADKLLLEAKEELTRQRTVFSSSLDQACKQALSLLKETVEQQLFSPALLTMVQKATLKPEALAGIITAAIKTLEREGTAGEISAYIPASVSVDEVNALLTHEVLQRLSEKTALLGTFAGGVQVRLKESAMILDITAEVLKEIVARYIRKDLREILYRSGNQ